MWLFFALTSAVSESVFNIYSKKLLKQNNEIFLAFCSSLMISLLLLPLILHQGIPNLSSNFIFAFLAAAVINTLTTVLVFKAFKSTDLSLAAPIFALSPVLLLVTSPIIIHEFPSIFGLVGVFLILGGTYYLNFKDKLSLAPFKELLTNPGQRIILVCCILWSISSNYYKIAVQGSSPVFFIFLMYLFIGLVLLPIILYKRLWKNSTLGFVSIFTLGIMAMATSLSESIAFSLGLVIYVLSIKRLSLLISVVFGSLILEEKNVLQRSISVIIMLAGLFLIALA